MVLSYLVVIKEVYYYLILEDINTAEEQVSIAREKGNISPNEPYTLQRLKVERFKEIENGD